MLERYTIAALFCLVLPSCGSTEFTAPSASAQAPAETAPPQASSPKSKSTGGETDDPNRDGGSGDEGTQPGKQQAKDEAVGSGTTAATGGLETAPEVPSDAADAGDSGAGNTANAATAANATNPSLDTSPEPPNPNDPDITDDDGASKHVYVIPRQLTTIYKKYQGNTNYYGKVEGDGPDAGHFQQIVCPSGAPSASGTAEIHFLVLVAGTWTKFRLGDTVPVDPAQPIYAKIGFDTHATSGSDDAHFTEDANVDIRSYFGPHPAFPDVSIAISTPGSPGSWRVGIGRGHDGTRHPPTPDLSYQSPPPGCD